MFIWKFRKLFVILNHSKINKDMKKILILIAVAVFAAGCVNRYDSVDPQEFAEALRNPDIQIIDTRTPQEYCEGHIPGAVNIDLDSEGFFEQMDSLDKDKPVAVYCRGGRRSKIAAERFVEKGFKVTELDGGIITWDGEIEK